MSNEKYEPIKFGNWQELAKYVIDGNDVYFRSSIDRKYIKVIFSGAGFNCDIERVFDHGDIYTKKAPTLEELIAIKPRLCWVWDGEDGDDEYRYIRIITAETTNNNNNICNFIGRDGEVWEHAQMLTDDEIKQFLDKEPS